MVTEVYCAVSILLYGTSFGTASQGALERGLVEQAWRPLRFPRKDWKYRPGVEAH
jgi:hypothetical protein